MQKELLMNRPLRLLAAAGLPALLAVACGSPISGLPPDLALEEMSQEQAVTMCEAMQRYVDDQISDAEAKAIACRFVATFAAAFAVTEERTGACQAAYDECLASAAEDADNTDCSEARPPSSCTSTTSEVEECFADTVAAYKELAASISCESIVEDLGEEGNNEEPASCANISDSCVLFSDAAAPMSGGTDGEEER
jgi:hypothetical protein